MEEEVQGELGGFIHRGGRGGEGIGAQTPGGRTLWWWLLLGAVF